MAADQFDAMSRRRHELPDAVLAARVVVRPVGARYHADRLRHFVLTAACPHDTALR